jgi:hypothetical protein
MPPAKAKASSVPSVLGLSREDEAGQFRSFVRTNAALCLHMITA